MEATARTVALDLPAPDISALEQELDILRRELSLLKTANKELERLVIRDTLTPLYNRRHFMNCLRDRLDRLERHEGKCALVFIDVNSMKRINDRFGHGAGDAALVHMARLLANGLRSTDVAARMGGDEFALLLDDLDPEAVEETTRRLQRMIAESACLHEGVLLPLSISVGWTALEQGDTEFSALTRADMAMYAAKRPGSTFAEAAE
ncbi:diguanylate cyclase (GGDEF)-like protein [Sphingobium sp. B2D3A]|uniref:GGDEF domain-containing protein n=1 Tax=unclassified Sphingobium TaxID=2611147 RepID=UPI0022257148|nr:MULTISPECIES: GGDEF domain-containing protein [unclassified Sphingobium]MCW2335778.1 diguanylate cyclase (GGDEF)-like protein [Sphingobium sp. B2D3A]MCW2368608.1 diguanylate cyclase (GGDEF)-like protein [Sphingobium sp. B11D3D]MCW2385537.1 diguanylate cyclase (GGDEF)-like protein [Sphingobium sp. B2D3D]MCW2391699.1 diguanylate cyclase (GGDEF)-like protein [Sphingobium sp. B11D3A]MCW2396864.1 diguanylate cyclase (GGDEF)-like protein [Sphingobium sp. B8D3B]